MPTPIDLIVTRLAALQPMAAHEQLILRVRLVKLFALDKDEHGYGSNKRGEGSSQDKADDGYPRYATKEAELAHHEKIGKAINALIEEHGVDWLGALVKMPAHERARRGLPQAA